MAIAARQQGLEDLLRRESDLGCDRLSRKVLGIDCVFSQVVRNTQIVEQADSVGLHEKKWLVVSDQWLVVERARRILNVSVQ